MLRSFDTRLPIELWHTGLAKLGKEELEYLQTLPSVTIKTASDHVLPGVSTSELKASLVSMALLYTEIQQVLYLSGETIPLQNPEPLFDSPVFVEEKVIMWPGFRSVTPKNPIFELLNIDCLIEKEADEGQLMVDKSDPKVVEALKMAMFLQRQWNLFSRILPDSFDLIRFAFRAVATDFHMVKWFPGLLGTRVQKKFCGNSMLSFSPIRNRAQKLTRADVLFFRVRKLGEGNQLPAKEVSKF